MSWQRRSRTRGPFVLLSFAALTLVDRGGSFLISASLGRGEEPLSSSIEQMPIPYALRSARLTALVSATRSSAPRTRGETLDGLASPKPQNPPQLRDLNTVAENAYWELLESLSCAITSTFIAEQRLLF